MAKGEIVEYLDLNGSSFFQCQSRAGQAFLDLGWKMDVIGGNAITASVPSKSAKDDIDGKVSVELRDGKCLLRFALKRPPMFGADNAAVRLLMAPFEAVFSQKKPAEGTDDAAKHGEEMLALVAEQNRRFEELKEKELAWKRRKLLIKACVMVGFDLAAIVAGMIAFGSFMAGLITLAVCQFIVWFLFKCPI